MLVLTRKVGEWIDVYERDGTRLFAIQAVDVRGSQTVRLGFQANPNIHIVRRELREAREDNGHADEDDQQTNKLAATTR